MIDSKVGQEQARTSQIPRLLMNLEEVAETLSISKHTVRAWTRSGKLQPVRICRRLLFSPQQVAQLVSGAIADRS